MDLILVFLSAGVSYLSGSISFARLVTKWWAPGKDVTDFEIPVEGTDDRYKVLPIGGNSVSSVLGPKAGMTVGILDILNVILPTLIFKVLYPEQPAYTLIVALGGLIGHIWPLPGRWVLEGGRVRVEAAAGDGWTIEGAPVASRVLAPDSAGKPDRLRNGTRQLQVIERSGKLALRVWDTASPTRTSFRGIDAFPFAARWRVEGAWEPYPTPREVETLSVIGLPQKELAPGKRLGLPTRQVELSSPLGKVRMGTTKLAEAGRGGPLLCRLFADLAGIHPASRACADSEVLLSAEIDWEEGGGIGALEILP